MIDSVKTEWVPVDIGYPGKRFEFELQPVEWATFARLHEALQAARTGAFWRAIRKAREASTPEEWAAIEVQAVEMLGAQGTLDPAPLAVGLAAAALRNIGVSLAHDEEFWRAAQALVRAGCTGRYRDETGVVCGIEASDFDTMRAGPALEEPFLPQRVPLTAILASVVVKHNTLSDDQKKT